MAFIRQVSQNEAEGPVARAYEAAQSRAGYIANILRVMSLDGHVLQGSMALYVNLMKRENALPAARREMLAAVVSNVNDCYY